jgi:HAD superfamily hydrolase (TIGR01450 family)
MPTPPLPPRVTIDELLARHHTLLLDAYGVLLHHGGPLPGARALIERLNRERRAYFILTNDASRLPETSAARLGAMGLEIPAERLITSASLLSRHFAERGLQGERTVVLGPEDSRRYVEQAGGIPVGPEDERASVLVICDEVGYSFVETVDDTLTLLFLRLDQGLPVHLVVPNPDLIYPKRERSFGFTAGAIAALVEAALRQRYPDRPELGFARLGKPNRPIFEEARRRARTSDLVMVGDQLGTDVKGALDFGIAAALVESGLDHYRPEGPIQPSYLLDGLG